MILILTTPHGASHRRASEALRSAFLEIDSTLDVKVEDALSLCSGWFRAYYNSYAIPLRYWPDLWRRIERTQSQGASTGPAWLYRWGARPLFSYLARVQPKVVVAAEVGVCEIAAMYKRRTHAPFFLVGLELMDFNRAWVQPEVDLYPVVHPDLGLELEAAGAPRAKIFSCGMPIDPRFSHLPDRKEARRQLGVASDLPLILVLFGGSGYGRPRPIVEALQRVRAPFRAVFIAGRNRRLESTLLRMSMDRDAWRILAWVDNVHEWMAAADLVLSKPGGATVMEAAAAGLPFLAFDPLPGNEERTCAWLEKWRVGVWIKSPGQLSAVVERLLEQPGERARLAAQSSSLSHPRAAWDIAKAILSNTGRVEG